VGWMKHSLRFHHEVSDETRRAEDEYTVSRGEETGGPRPDADTFRSLTRVQRRVSWRRTRNGSERGRRPSGRSTRPLHGGYRCALACEDERLDRGARCNHAQ
jgi:hypothetical protein